MPYIYKDILLFPSTVSAQALTSAADVLTYSSASHCELVRAVCKITTAVVSTVTVVVQFVKRPTPGSSSGEVVLATVNIPTGAAVGTSYYAEASSKTAGANAIGSGQELIVRVLTAAAGGSAAGAILGLPVVCEDPEVAANEANLILSS